ncbi:glycoside hydrolase family 1 protein [Carnobacterium maltaromaticum]|uniref:glycoside hydrolase family 1 protein n=1 Tax=Carnobacterium maltaromaticum TaxID=2751 RepID=UPI00070566F2|nr:glycoside hydrolase family 1 protein [Carnobacterium maltaromaticum]KRN86236.1 6-phospho-beta-glucosidase [Carnobacterium maltaromaticum]MDT1946233.1 glycoside hydrolase family 1 protein [Carnobacterium maltaromaticum]MDT1999810.1 glycoside hydrolase family 1 protein [Carnobacterium maltaromaticum]TFJ32418.1 glycoside hydrolase family 1 protein [Carnobacterium maltaromaticum]TFJ35768.1 glycoside hydrolase family 1 protein [Carnobacterium maltaromaticum]
MENKRIQFPDGFWWGSAWSAEQAEGRGETGKAETIWERWFKEEPNRFYNRVSSEIATDHIHRYKEDVQLMKETGHNSFRVSISWARMFPDDGIGLVNPLAIEFYRSLFTEMNQNGIAVFANLYHFDMPAALQDQGGWESREVVEAYVRFAKTCFEEFGDLVSQWFTFNEPLGPILGTYLECFHYPNIVDFKRGAQAAFNTIFAHARAIEEFKKLGLSSKIGVILNLSPTYPRSQHPADVEAAEIADQLYTRSFLDPMVLGHFPKKLVALLKEHDQLPVYSASDLEIIQNNTAQLLGLNYYEPRRVKARLTSINPAGPFLPDWFFEPYIMPGRKMNHYRGWEIYERGIYELCMDIKDNYGNIESFISENGMGVADEERFMDENGYVEDDYRIEYIQNHLAFVWKAIEEGANIKGYHLWTFIDCWSWINAYKNRYGLVSLNLATQERTIKKSGEMYKKMSEENGFEFDLSQLY